MGDDDLLGLSNVLDFLSGDRATFFGEEKVLFYLSVKGFSVASSTCILAKLWL